MIKPRALTSISFTFPCYNEEANVGAVIEQAVKTGEEYGVDYEVVVVDDGSRDRTADVVRQWAQKNPRVKLVRHDYNIGYGAGVRSGIKHCTKDLLLLTDGDNQFHISDIEKLFSKIDSCDVVAGYRLSRKDHAGRRLNGFLWSHLTRLLFGLKLRDMDCAFKLIRRKCLQGIDLRSDQLLINAEMLGRLKKKGCKIQEIGIPHYARTAGKATATHPVKILKTFGELASLYWNIR